MKKKFEFEFYLDFTVQMILSYKWVNNNTSLLIFFFNNNNVSFKNFNTLQLINMKYIWIVYDIHHLENNAANTLLKTWVWNDTYKEPCLCLL